MDSPTHHSITKLSPTRTSKKSIDTLRKDKWRKVKYGFATFIKWKRISNKIPPNLKIYLVAEIQHKSRPFPFILYISFGIKLNGIILPSVNNITTRLSPQESMNELGNVIPHIISKMAASSRNTDPWYLSKFDIKYGYWRLRVAPNDVWNFAYVLTKFPSEINTDKTDIFIPSSVQMV